MIKLKDLLDTVDLDEQTLHVVLDSNSSSIQVYDFNKYHDYTVGFIRSHDNDLVIRLFNNKGGKL